MVVSAAGPMLRLATAILIAGLVNKTRSLQYLDKLLHSKHLRSQLFSIALAKLDLKMKVTAKNINRFNIIKLPSVFLMGIRVKELTNERCVAKVKHRWINQNPFKSMFWAVQGMAAELTTGAMVIKKIRESGKKVSMLVTNNSATFTKKATGRITFVCNDGHLIDDALNESIKTGEGQSFWMESVGTNEEGTVVSTFKFEWSVKVKPS
ncbi:DUF4442 domain-containing protein [Saprospiraceae bacterium]|nr:DUF4442 domain-containing protein [Saprospiraceae bacterium]